MSTLVKKKDEAAKVNRGFRFSQRTVDTLERLVKRYGAGAPKCLGVNKRMLLEALIEYADSHEIPFSELVGLEAGVEE